MIGEYFPDNVNGDSCPSTPFNKMLIYTDVISAKQDGKFIVHPKWLTSCLALSRRLPEVDFIVGDINCPDQQTKKSECHSSNLPVEPKLKIPRTGVFFYVLNLI